MSVGTDGPVRRVLVPQTDEERRAILEQLEIILGSPLFTGSKRYPRFLRYIVEETLAGRGDGLKERALGMAVFGREPLYDTNLDPVVRTSAAQVRQRITRYYAEPNHKFELRIRLTPGTYVPEFHPPNPFSEPVPVPEMREHIPASPLHSDVDQVPPHPLTPKLLAILGFSAAALLTLLFFLWRMPAVWAKPDASAKFWKPLWDERASIVFCVPGRFPTDSDAPDNQGHPKPLTIRESLRLNSVAWPDASTLYTLVGFVRAHGGSYTVRRAGDSSLADLRSGPTVFVGGFNNPWLLRLQERLRFTYQRDIVNDRGLIRDNQHPEQTVWRVEWETPYSSFDEDFGIVSRVWDPVTERVVMIVSGIAAYGTIAAGEFVTNPRYLELIAANAPKGWENKNIQVVFSTKVFNGQAGPPRIIAVHVW